MNSLEKIPMGFTEIDLPKTEEGIKKFVGEHKGKSLLVLREGDKVYESGKVRIPDYGDKDNFFLEGNAREIMVVKYLNIVSIQVPR